MAQSPFPVDALFCQEDNFFTQEHNLFNDYSTPTQDLFWDDEELITLFSKEKSNLLSNELEKDSFLDESRREAISWILNVVEFYSFSHVTAVLALDYLDRFLFSTQLKSDKPWMSQLIALACLSIAAKFEETHVPLLLDLQIEETRYVFEAKTIQRMEILVLSTLEWKMNSVTPISFIDHFARRFGFENRFCCDFVSRCECLIVDLVSDTRFMKFLPSVLATATMLHIMNTFYPCSETEYRNEILNTTEIDKEQLDDCVKLISDSKIGFFCYNLNKRKHRSITAPGSPNGVIDVCFSSDDSNDRWPRVAELATASVSSSPDPPAKKIRTSF